MDWKKLFQRFPSMGISAAVHTGITPGLHHYQRQADGTTARFHLRINTSGSGLLLANAASAVRLHPSGVMIAKGILDGENEEAIVKSLIRVFRGVTRQQALVDFKQVQSLIASMEKPSHDYPIINQTDPSFSSRADLLERPISADVPLGSLSQMEPILKRLWEEGIPHVTIITGNNSAEKDLLYAVEKAEDLGLITGVRGRGSDLAHGMRIANLAQAGLDHLDIYYLSSNEKMHNALVEKDDYNKAIKSLTMAHKNEVCPVAVVSLVKQTLATIDETLAAIANLNIANACLFAVATTNPMDVAKGALLGDELVQAAAVAEEAAERHKMRLFWYPPIKFNAKQSLSEQICSGPRTSGDTAIHINLDGSVIPARGLYKSAGNILKQSWDTIANLPEYVNYQRRLETDTHCPTCPGLAICAADCPKNPEGWAIQTDER